MILALVLLPMAAGLAAFLIRSDRVRRGLLVGAAAVHAGLVAASWVVRPVSGGTSVPGLALSGWLALDAPGLLFLSIASGLFLVAAVYGVGYLGREKPGRTTDFQEGLIFTNEPETIFTGCLLFFLGTMSLVCVSQHFGLLWVAVEATTLASAPLIYFHRHHRSLEAVWKYLLICSVGIALALLGNFFLAMSAVEPGGESTPMVLSDLVEHAGRLHHGWLKAAFLLFLVGYGTKMGLAPMHTWLPDAHSEAPSVVSALLSGVLLNCAFLGILRAYQVCAAAGEAAFAQDLLVFFGLLSMVVAAVFILGQTDYKRMLAYSSVEHMGILALGVGLGGAGLFGSMLHAVNHSAAKAMLFLVAGNILAAYKTKSIRDVQGLLRMRPATGALWVAGMLAITGSPPFGLFLSEFTILKAALDQGHPAVAAAFLAILALIFIAMSSAVLRMAHGEASTGRTGAPGLLPAPEAGLALASPMALAAFVLMLGLYVPSGLSAVLREAATALGAN